MSNGDQTMRASGAFLEEIEDIQVQRIKNGKDKKIRTVRRITDAIVRHSFWKRIKEDIIDHTLKDKKGQVGLNLIFFMILALFFLIFCATWIYFNQTLEDELTSIPDVADQKVNISQAAADTFGQVNDAMVPGLRVLTFVVLFAMVFSMLMVEFFTRKHPAFLIIDFFIVIVAFILSVSISNSYENFLTGEVISSSLHGFKGATSVMLHLPRWVTVVGLFGIALSLIGVIRRRGTEGFK